MEISKTKIDKRMQRKTNPYLVETIKALKRTNTEIAKILVMPKRKWLSMNLEEIERKVASGDKILVPGKVLSSGNLSKKLKIVAWSISDKAEEKLKESKSEFVLLVDEMKKNPELKDLKVLK